MIELSPQLIKHLAEIYIVANIPSYLWRHFRAEPSVQILAKNHSVKELIKCIVQIENEDCQSLEKLVLAYAAIVALTYRDMRTVKTTLKDLKFTKLAWANAIFEMWEKEYTPTSEVRYTEKQLTPKPKIISPGTFTKEPSSTLQKQIIHKPTITNNNPFSKKPSSTINILKKENK